MPPPAPCPQHRVCSREQHQDLLGGEEALLWAGGWGNWGSGSGGGSRRESDPGRGGDAQGGLAGPAARPGRSQGSPALSLLGSERTRSGFGDAGEMLRGKAQGGRQEAKGVWRSQGGGGLRGHPYPSRRRGEADRPVWAVTPFPLLRQPRTQTQGQPLSHRELVPQASGQTPALPSAFRSWASFPDSPQTPSQPPRALLALARPLPAPAPRNFIPWHMPPSPGSLPRFPLGPLV